MSIMNMDSNVNIEMKTRIDKLEPIRQYLFDLGAVYIGEDQQVDTYFKVPTGRLKIREGTIENCIVHYVRPDLQGPKRCDYSILKYTPNDPNLGTLKNILNDSLSILIVVKKMRQIYYLGNVKFHLDEVTGLGSFFEIEVIAADNSVESEMRKICETHLEMLGIDTTYLESGSYSDMLLAKENL